MMLPSPLRSAPNPLGAILILLAKAVASGCPRLPSTGSVLLAASELHENGAQKNMADRR